MIYNFKTILKKLNRRKPVDESFESPLRRCLVFIDLLLLGIGGSVDVALYVVLGNVIRDIAGPSVLISMLFGLLVCLGSGLCYAEFASYIPSSGSDYDYIYASLGEICGFFDGWSVLVASVIATAALARGAADLLSSLTDSMSFDNIDAHVELPNNVLLSSHLNIMALLVFLVTLITSLGVHGSIRFNDCIVAINLLVVIFTVILGLFHLDFDLWSSWDKFAPYGVSGILKSLPFTVFFYGGFISVTFSTEEVINPSAILPRSIVWSIIGIFLVFLSVGFVQSLVLPYNKLPLASPLSDGFGIVAFNGSKYIIAVGGFCSCLSSVLTASYANSRLSYVISRDGLLMYFLRRVNKHTQVPISAVVTTGFIAALLASCFDLTLLVEVCSILVLLPYILLSYAILAIRYKENPVSVPVDVLGSDQQLQANDVGTEHGIACLQEPELHKLLPVSTEALTLELSENIDGVEPTTEVPTEVLMGNGAMSDMPECDSKDGGEPITESPMEALISNGTITDKPEYGYAREPPTNLPTEGKMVDGMSDVLPGLDEQLYVHTVTRDSGGPKDKLPTNNFMKGSVKFNIKAAIGVLVVSTAGLSLVVRFGISYNINSTLFGVLIGLFIIPLVVSIFFIWRTPYTKVKFPFTMPFFPVLPLLCLAMTVFTMFQFSLWSWILFIGNTTIGFIIYFCYGINHSEVQKNARTEAAMTTTEL